MSSIHYRRLDSLRMVTAICKGLTQSFRVSRSRRRFIQMLTLIFVAGDYFSNATIEKMRHSHFGRPPTGIQSLALFLDLLVTARRDASTSDSKEKKRHRWTRRLFTSGR